MSYLSFVFYSNFYFLMNKLIIDSFIVFLRGIFSPP